MSDTDQNTDRLPESSPEAVQQKTAICSETGFNPEKQSARQSDSTGTGLAGFALLISACALGLSGYIGWRTMGLEQSQPVLREGMDQLQTQIARQQARLTTVVQNTSTDIDKHRGQLQELQQREAWLVSRMDTLSAKVRELEGSTHNQWRSAEVEYLLRLANQRLVTVNDVAGALKLMASAEHILGQLDDYSLFPAREALAEDMAVLKATTTVDQENTWLRLQALAELIPDLVILDESHIADIASSPAPESAPAGEVKLRDNSTWQQIIKAMLLDTWHRFTSLFRINTQKQPVEVLLTPEQDQLIRQKMLLMIEQSKLALISGQQSIYQNSLQQASDWLHRYFMLGGEVSNQLAAELLELQGLSITPKMPGIHRALDALREHQSNSVFPPEQEGDSPTALPDKIPDKIPDKMEPAPDDGRNSEPVTEPDQPAEQGVQIS